jgi:CheY-like chemotaxis protein/two-component sensor histidine kinase
MEAIGRLAGGVAHDFNNLLTVINGYAQLALNGFDPSSPQRENLEEIVKAGARAASLTGQLLAHSRKQVLTPRIWNLNAIISGVQGMLARLLGEDVEVVTVLDQGVGAVRVDRGQIEQIIMNLAVNARDAMSAGGKLTIETTNVSPVGARPQTGSDAEPGPDVLLAVSDTGSGMTDEVKAHLFEPFFTTKEPGRGTGLGLSTVYGIVRQSGGRISVDSELGRGTRFGISFPSVAITNAPPAEPVRRSPVARGGSEAVLVVEDQDAVRALISKILRGNGYRVHEAANGDEALRLLVEEHVHVSLVITDVIMPSMGGRELGRRLREQAAPPPVLYMSGYPYPGVATDDDLPGESILQKPFSPSELLQKVHEVLEREV